MTPAGPDLPLLPPQGRIEGRGHLYPVRVYFEDTDAGGVAYHASYLRWMERARTEMLRVAGIDHGGAMASGMGSYAVASVSIRYLAPARLDDALILVTDLAEARAASLVIQQRVRRGAAVLADAEVVVAWLAADGRPRRQPAVWMDLYRGLIESIAAPPATPLGDA